MKLCPPTLSTVTSGRIGVDGAAALARRSSGSLIALVMSRAARSVTGIAGSVGVIAVCYLRGDPNRSANTRRPAPIP